MAQTHTVKGIEDNNGSIRIRFKFQGKKFTLTDLGNYDDAIAMGRAIGIKSQIDLDIKLGKFYAVDNSHVEAIYNPSIAPTPSNAVPVPTGKRLLSHCEALQKALDAQAIHLRHGKDTLAHMTKNKGQILPTLSKATYTKYSQYLTKAIDWCKAQGLDCKEFVPVEVKTTLKDIERKAKTKPFTKDEIHQIVGAFRSGTFDKKGSQFSDSLYADFVEFLFSSGTRLGEACALTWDCIDFDNNVIQIQKAVGNDDATGKRVVKLPKNVGSIRTLPLPANIRSMLLQRYALTKPNKTALVFPSPEGKAIDRHNFLTRQWKRVLAGLGLDYRVPYACRHTFASHALVQSQGNFAGVAKLLGHKDTNMVIKHYGQSIGSDVMPNLF